MQESATHTMSVVEEGTTLLDELKIQSAKTGEPETDMEMKTQE